MNTIIARKKIAVLTGSGISVESGLPTFRDARGMWRSYAWQEVASPEGWEKNPGLVLEFYNERRASAWKAQPNAAHLAITRLESTYEVVVITQNVDELHERAGSKNVIHVHGNLAYARSSQDPSLSYRIDGNPITLGQTAADGSQLRPDVVWFGEEVRNLDQSIECVAKADKVLVVGTSLAVFPFASLVTFASENAEKVLVTVDLESIPPGFMFIRGNASAIIPELVDRWIRTAGSGRDE
jgi:NAD-dependent deacetylase